MCSQCGMESTRRGNVLRHIKNQHGGSADALQSSFISEERSNSRASLNVERGTSRYPNFSSVKNIQQIIDAHVEEILKQRLTTLQSPNSIGYQGFVCEDCLTIDIDPISRSERLYHHCNTLWLIDHQQLVDHKNLVKQYLKNHLAVFLAKGLVINRHIGGKIELSACEVNRSFIFDPKEYLLKPTPGADLTTLQVYNVTNISLTSGRDPRYQWLEPIELAFLAKDHWANRVINNGRTAVSQEELISFIRESNNRTASIFKTSSIQPKYYIIRVEL